MIPSNISKILVCLESFCVEANIRYVGCDKFTWNPCQSQWNDNILTLDKILHLNKLTTKVWINVLQIHDINDVTIGGKSKESHILLYQKLTSIKYETNRYTCSNLLNIIVKYMCFWEIAIIIRNVILGWTNNYSIWNGIYNYIVERYWIISVHIVAKYFVMKIIVIFGIK